MLYTAAGAPATTRPDSRTIVGAVNPRSAFRVSTTGTPLSTTGFQLKLE